MRGHGEADPLGAGRTAAGGEAVIRLRQLEGLPCMMRWDQGNGTEKVYRGMFHIGSERQPCGFWLRPGPGGFVEGRRLQGPVSVWWPTSAITLEFGSTVS